MHIVFSDSIIFYHFFRIFNLKALITHMYMEYIPCIGNSSYSFWRILLKLYSCFQDGLKICICFQDPDHFFSLYATDMYNYALYRQPRLQF